MKSVYLLSGSNSDISMLLIIILLLVLSVTSVFVSFYLVRLIYKVKSRKNADKANVDLKIKEEDEIHTKAAEKNN